MNNNRSDSPEAPLPGVVNILPEILEQPQQPYDEDDHSGEIREYNGVFEGPEKTLGEFKCCCCSYILSTCVYIPFNLS